MDTPEPAPASADIPPVGSIAKKSFARFAGEAAAMVFMAVTGVVVARSLGPEGKGVIAVMSLLVTVFALASSLGLGDAAIILVGRRRARLRAAGRATAFVAPAAGVTGAVALYGLLALQFSADWGALRLAALFAALAVVPLTLVRALTGVIESQGRILATTVVHVLVAGTTTVATVAFVFLLRYGVPGAAAGLALGPVAGALALAVYARRQGIPMRPGWDRDYLGAALRVGIPAQSAYVLAALAARIDTLIVYALVGGVAAGHYSVALTLGHLIMYAPQALAIAAFPALTHGDDDTLRELSARLARTTVITALVSGAALAALIPVITVPVFGHGFQPSITPALLLLPAGLLASIQWALCRIAAARGQTGLLFRSYLASVATMVLLDFALIPALGIVGAALASVAGSAVGAAVAYPTAKRFMGLASPLALLPRRGDWHETWTTVRQTLAPGSRRS